MAALLSTCLPPRGLFEVVAIARRMEMGIGGTAGEWGRLAVQRQRFEGVWRWWDCARGGRPSAQLARLDILASPPARAVAFCAAKRDGGFLGHLPCSASGRACRRGGPAYLRVDTCPEPF